MAVDTMKAGKYVGVEVPDFTRGKWASRNPTFGI